MSEYIKYPVDLDRQAQGIPESLEIVDIDELTSGPDKTKEIIKVETIEVPNNIIHVEDESIGEVGSHHDEYEDEDDEDDDDGGGAPEESPILKETFIEEISEVLNKTDTQQEGKEGEMVGISSDSVLGKDADKYYKAAYGYLDENHQLDDESEMTDSDDGELFDSEEEGYTDEESEKDVYLEFLEKMGDPFIDDDCQDADYTPPVEVTAVCEGCYGGPIPSWRNLPYVPFSWKYSDVNLNDSSEGEFSDFSSGEDDSIVCESDYESDGDCALYSNFLSCLEADEDISDAVYDPLYVSKYEFPAAFQEADDMVSDGFPEDEEDEEDDDNDDDEEDEEEDGDATQHYEEFCEGFLSESRLESEDTDSEDTEDALDAPPTDNVAVEKSYQVSDEGVSDYSEEDDDEFGFGCSTYSRLSSYHNVWNENYETDEEPDFAPVLIKAINCDASITGIEDDQQIDEDGADSCNYFSNPRKRSWSDMDENDDQENYQTPKKPRTKEHDKELLRRTVVASTVGAAVGAVVTFLGLALAGSE